MDNPTRGSSLTSDLPSFNNPPINEVVCGMRFHPFDKLLIPHIGLLWGKFRRKYPIIRHAPPIAGSKGEMPVDNVTGLPLPRVWFINKADDQLIQFQFDRFYFNWRRRRDVYPRYPYVISNFESLVHTMVNFFDEFELGKLEPIEYELSYINHIQKGQEWNTIDDLPKIFSDFVWRQATNRFLLNPENIAWQANFPLPGKKGLLAVNLKQAIRLEDKVPLLVLELAARGLGDSTSKTALREWFNTAHEWIVRGFTDLTTYEVRTIFWKQEGGA